LPPFLITV
jgi:hypothetical protein